MRAVPAFPRNYRNTGVKKALDDLALVPTLDGLASLMIAATKGGLAVDVTGSDVESGTRIRTIASTDGRPVLPLFTSIAEVELAIGKEAGGKRIPVKATIIPARDALALIETADFIAVQFDPGSNAQVVVRSHIETALTGTARSNTR